MHITTLEVDRTHFRRTRFVRAEALPLTGGQSLAEVDRFALTANNVSYALSGDMIGYWRFYPGSADPWGVTPVWGHATVVDSRSDVVPVGARLWGFLPMASHVVLTLEPAGARALLDVTPHRKDLPAVYNRYDRIAPDRTQRDEDEQSLLQPLFVTSYLLFDYLQDNEFFGARSVLIGSASSKTGFGLAELLNRHARDRVRVIGLTSASNRGFVERLGFFDKVVAYEDIAALEAPTPAVFVDMGGAGAVVNAVHDRFGERLAASVQVGATHWEAQRRSAPRMGPPPTFFFAPSQIAKRDQDWGPGEVLRRARTEMVEMTARARPHLRIVEALGPEATQTALLRLLDGAASPDQALIASLNPPKS